MLAKTSKASRIKIYAPTFGTGFMQTSPAEEDMPLLKKWPILGPLPGADQWEPHRATWWHRSGRRLKVPAICRSTPSIAVRSGALDQLGPDLASQVEPLPFSVEGEPWLLLRPRHRLMGIDPATCTALRDPPHTGEVRWYGWLNAIDPLAEAAMIFDTKPGGGLAWVTDEFVRRVKAAGLEGVRFVHSGYLVRDLADAVPDPTPEKRFPWANTVPPQTSPPAAKVEALDAERLAARDQARQHANRLLPVAAADSASEYINRLDDWLEEVSRQWKRLRPAARAERVAATTAAFGDLVCRELGWQWGTLHAGDDEPCLAIANADKTCALRIERFAERQFTANDRTLKLQFNLLRAGQWPAPPASGPSVIA